MLRISDGALVAAANLGAQFIADRYLPDKAIDLIDEASARVRLSGCGLPKAAKDLDKELREVLQAKDVAIREQDFDEAGHCRDLEMEIRTQITLLIQKEEGISKNKAKYKTKVEEEHNAENVYYWTGNPVSKV
jgi:ATP-dependent Clp protease ATP-binding subunit ClpC